MPQYLKNKCGFIRSGIEKQLSNYSHVEKVLIPSTCEGESTQAVISCSRKSIRTEHPPGLCLPFEGASAALSDMQLAYICAYIQVGWHRNSLKLHGNQGISPYSQHHVVLKLHSFTLNLFFLSWTRCSFRGAGTSPIPWAGGTWSQLQQAQLARAVCTPCWPSVPGVEAVPWECFGLSFSFVKMLWFATVISAKTGVNSASWFL